jgi:hypothetical protein
MSLPSRGDSPVTIEEVLGTLERDQPRHMTGEPSSEQELDLIEKALGRRLPREFRALLARFGGGILYERHEVFGARRLMVHDIELVPDLVSFHRRFVGAGGGELYEGFLPFHRADGVIHLFDLRAEGGPSIMSLDGTHSYPDLARFLEAVVLPVGVDASP